MQCFNVHLALGSSDLQKASFVDVAIFIEHQLLKVILVKGHENGSSLGPIEKPQLSRQLARVDVVRCL